jgi:hypothetical protein
VRRHTVRGAMPNRTHQQIDPFEATKGPFHFGQNLSEQKLMGCLNRLGYDIEIKLSPATESVGRRTLAVA